MQNNEMPNNRGFGATVNYPLATLFEQFLKERTYLKNVTPSTLLWYRIAFQNYCHALGTTAPALPTKSTLQQFVIHERDCGVKPVTVNTYVTAMNALCTWLHAEGHIVDRVKLGKLRVEKRVLELLNDAQLRMLIGYKPRTYRQWRTHTTVLLILDTGLRVSEALNLRHGDVNADNLILKVFGKGQKERLVPFSPELRRRLYRFEQLKSKKGIRSEFLFAGFGGVRWEKRNATTSLHLLLKSLGLPRFGWHRLRHTFATILARRERIKQRTLQRRRQENLQRPHDAATRSEVSLHTSPEQSQLL